MKVDLEGQIRTICEKAKLNDREDHSHDVDDRHESVRHPCDVGLQMHEILLSFGRVNTRLQGTRFNAWTAQVRYQCIGVAPVESD